MEQQIYDALCCDSGGLMLFLLTEQDWVLKKRLCSLSKAFKARNTGVRETHRIQWKKGEAADVYTLSDLPKTEHVSHAYIHASKSLRNGIGELGYANLKVTYCTYVQQTSIAPANGR
jgi:hypothetical protein